MTFREIFVFAVYLLGAVQILKFVWKLMYMIDPDWDKPSDAPNDASEDYVPGDKRE